MSFHTTLRLILLSSEPLKGTFASCDEMCLFSIVNAND